MRNTIRFLNRNMWVYWTFLLVTMMCFSMLFAIAIFHWPKWMILVDAILFLFLLACGFYLLIAYAENSQLRNNMLRARQEHYHNMIIDCMTAGRWDDAKYLYNNVLKDKDLRYFIHGVFVGDLLAKNYSRGLDTIVELKF